MLKTLFYILFFYYLFKVIARLFAPYLLKRMKNKMNQRFQNQFNQKDSPVEKEGEVSIKTKPRKSKTDTDDMGEYVDFEEVDE